MTEVIKVDSPSIQSTEDELRILSFPHPAEGLREVTLPVCEVTLLEDRAQVSRKGTVSLELGRNRLLIRDVAPVLQDVSLRGGVIPASESSVTSAQVVDLKARRAVRVRSADKPTMARELEGELEKLKQQFIEVGEDREHCRQRYGVVLDMLFKSVTEIPQDASWGLVNHQTWHDTFETLCKRGRGLLDGDLEHYFTQLDFEEEAIRLGTKRLALDRWDTAFVACIEAELETEGAGDVELKVEYVVPNALWRPFHTATLKSEGRLRFQSSAAVWQNTGEDWRDVQLSFSTARASLGTEPPRLSDDLLQAQRKAETIIVEQRQVEVQSAGHGRGGARKRTPGAIELPGVDDGGDVQNLRGQGVSTVLSDGRLNVIPVAEFETAVERTLICVPELEPKVFRKTSQINELTHPILAGPVELILEGGVSGWTKVLFIASGERFELSFGHDDGLRVYRTISEKSETDLVDQWTRRANEVVLYMSNLEGKEKQVEVVERIPVSELEHVQVKLLEKDCEPGLPELDDKGFCRWKVTIPPNDHTILQLSWEVATAPGVEGL